jgi:hypothetical protein
MTTEEIEQLAINWYTENGKYGLGDDTMDREIKAFIAGTTWQAKRTYTEEVLKQALIDAYNAGYTDAQVNHINDAENFVNELLYAPRIQTFIYDGEIMGMPDRIKNDPDWTIPYTNIKTK